MSTETPGTNPSGTAHQPADHPGPPDARQLHLLITRDDDGTYSAVVWNLPGAGSCGPTETEAVERAKEAALGVVEGYEAAGADIPWRDVTTVEVPPGAKHRVVVLDA